MRRIVLLILGMLLSNLVSAHPGVGIVMDQAGNVFYTDLVHVWKIAPDGSHTIAVENVHTHDLYLDSNGDLYGEHEWHKGNDEWGNYVWCLSKDGILETYLPEVEGFLDNTTLIRDAEGTSYWIQKSANSNLLMKELSDGSTHLVSEYSFDNVRWMHYSEPNQLLYLVDNLAIKAISKSGEVAIIHNNLKEGTSSFSNVADHHYVFGLWDDINNNLYVALYGAKKVKKIDSEGTLSTVFESSMGWSPCGGLIDQAGNLWVMEFSRWNATRVRKVVPDGNDVLYSG